MPEHRPRPRPSRPLRERLFQASGGVCQRDGCATAIDLDAFHVAHLRSHAHGGALVESNLEAWCSRCNLTWGVDDVKDTRTLPREWQLEALDRVVSRITNDGAATVSAAPGAGKTIFAGLVFEALHDADVIDRMVVFAPRRTLVQQWNGALRTHRHVELKPGGELERPGQSGVITTYQSLNPDTVGIHRQQARLQRTLLVLDEVHHLGEKQSDGTRPAWARNVADFAGEVDGELHVAGVLNLSGTLWRTAPDQRISTVRYHAATDKYGRPVKDKIESDVDFDVPAERLIQEGQLRPIDLHTIDGRVELFETAKFELVRSDMADLEEAPARATLRELAAQSPWRQRFVAKILAQLQAAHRALDGHPVKALIVAATQNDARLFQDEVNEQMRELHLNPLAEIAVSDEPEAVATLERFRRSDRVGVLCTVDMAGEGYDCPDIAVIGYATNKLTHQYACQVVARAMRVTDTERKTGRIIPAAVVVPEVKVLVETLKRYLAPMSHEVMLEEQQQRDRSEGSGDGQGPRLVDQPYIIESVIPTQERITIPLADGESTTFTAEQLEAVAAYLDRYNVPAPLHARTLAAMAEWLTEQEQRNPFDPRISGARARVTEPRREQMGVEEICTLRMKQLSTLEGWWAKNGDGSIAIFANRANREGGIKNGMRESASPKQLDAALEFERDQIERFCQINGLTLPRRMREDQPNA